MNRSLRLGTGVAIASVVLFGLARQNVPGSTDAPPVPLRDATGLNLFQIIEGDVPVHEFPPDVLPTSPSARPEAELPVPEDLGFAFDHYPDPEELAAFLRELENRYPHLVRVSTIGESSLGRPILAVRLAAEDSSQPFEDRPAMLIDGQHHARELISAQVVLYTLWRLCEGYGADPLTTHLLNTRVVYSVPSVNPDGNAIALRDYQAARRTANPAASDDDGDGAFDEDWSEGFGFGTHDLRRYTFDQDWADTYPDNPFMSGWWEHLQGTPEYLGRFRVAEDGSQEPIPLLDRDGDGSQHEDELGGVDANRNYDAHWSQGVNRAADETYRGPEVWSEPEVRAMRDFVLELGTLASAVSHHSGVDVLLHPWGWSASEPLLDAQVYELLSRKGSQLTEAHGFRGSAHTWTARGLYAAAGSTMDWLYETAGAYAWTPEVYGSGNTTLIERLGATGTFTVGQASWSAFNPPEDEIVASADRWRRFSMYILAATPNLQVLGVHREADEIVIAVANDGLLPVDVLVRQVEPTVEGEPDERRLSAAASEWRLPVPQGADTARFEVIGALVVGTKPHGVERLVFDVRINADSVRLVGELSPFYDLGAAFDGWYADGWETGGYHRGPEIPVVTPTPPSGATPKSLPATPVITAAPTEPSTSETPTAVSETRSPTASPTPDATRSPDPVLLPHVLAYEGVRR